jgi:hypothetical protein
MERHAVSSSNVASIGYDGDGQVLEVEFHTGAVYRYFDVPGHVVEALASAGSVGSYFATYVRNAYRCTRV